MVIWLVKVVCGDHREDRIHSCPRLSAGSEGDGCVLPLVGEVTMQWRDREVRDEVQVIGNASPMAKFYQSVWMYLTSSRFKQFQSTGEQAHLKDILPPSKRENNTKWHIWQNGQTATEQPAQTQVVHEYRCLSGRRGREASHSTHTQKSKAKRRNIDICGTREISDLARPLGTMTY